MSTATEAETTTDDDREAGERPRQGDVLYKKEKIWVSLTTYNQTSPTYKLSGFVGRLIQI